MKNVKKIALILLLLAVSVFIVTSCNNKENVVDIPDGGSISVTEEGMPQLVYVQGEELDLSNGLLTISGDAETKEIPLNSEGVSVSGYDKNKLGEQTVTITYGDKTCQITVTVVERMQAEGVVTDYLMGDEFNLSEGRLKITRNDGSSYTVVLGNDKVTLSGFDSSKTSKQTVTAKYDSGDGVYECKFEVTVYAIESISFNAPKKTAYKSHETEMDLTNGSFTLTGNGGALKREVAVTADMVKGFDLSAATEENTSVKQKLTVSYDDTHKYDYEITIVYTDISLFKKHSASFAHFDWNAEVAPTVGPELGELALDLMERYLDLSKAEKLYITDDETLAVVRAAFMYGMEAMNDDFTVLGGAFELAEDGLYLTCESPEAVRAALVILEDYNSSIYEVSPLLAAIIEEFANAELMTGVKFSEFGVLDEESYEVIADILNYMLELHEKFEAIPADWRTAGVENYASQIQAAYNTIVGSEYRTTFGELYLRVGNWSGDKAVYDAMFAYYYAKEDMSSLRMLSSVSLPGELQLLASYIYAALSEVDSISNYAQFDTSLFFYYYQLTIDTRDSILNGDDVMIKYLYENMPINELFGFDSSVDFHFDAMIEYICNMEGGFYHFSGGLMGVEKYHELMKKYMEIILQLSSDDDEQTYEKSPEYGADVEEMFHLYMELSPTQQFNFLSTLNAFYGMNIPPIAFDNTGEYAELISFFVNIVNDYHSGLFTEDAVNAYYDLVIAIELYAQRFNSDWRAEFDARMENVKDIYDNKMTDADRAEFDRYLKALYDKYVALAERADQTVVDPDTMAPTVELGEWADEFAELEEALASAELSYILISEGGSYVYGMFFSAFERAQAIADYILANAPQEIIDIYYYDAIYSLEAYFEKLEGEGGGTGEDGTEMGGDSTGSEETVYTFTSFEYKMALYRTIYVNFQLTMLPDIGSIYDFYNAGDLSDFFAKTYYLTWAYIYSDGDADTLDYDREKVLEAINMFRNLSIDERVIFTFIEGDYSYYYYALDAFIVEAFTENAADVAGQLLGLEQGVLIYAYSPSEATLASLAETLENLKVAYAALEGEDKASFADLEDMYAYYVELCETIIAESTANA